MPILVVFLTIFSCVPKSLILNQTEIVSFYFDQKLKKLESNKNNVLNQKRAIIQTKVEYAFGILMEKGDMLVNDDYFKALKYYSKANQLFLDAENSSKGLLSDRYPNFNKWLKNENEISFTKNDIIDLYWLAAAIGGAIQSSRGSNPFLLINLPQIGKLLSVAIQLDPQWGNGKLYSAMMSYTMARPDLSGKTFDDTLNFYYNKALQYSDSLDASIFVSYAESVHKSKQEKEAFLEKLNFVVQMNIQKGSHNEINNIISKKRAIWLLSKTEDYFLE